jgi:hypothetical protein
MVLLYFLGTKNHQEDKHKVGEGETRLADRPTDKRKRGEPEFVNV